MLKQSSTRNVRSPYFFRQISRFLRFVENIMLSSIFVFPFSLPTLGGTIGIRVPFVRHYEVVCVTAVNDTTEKMRHRWLLHIVPEQCGQYRIDIDTTPIVLILIPHPLY